ncbi:DUF4157 domain-containing protein [Thalassomonas haliotis]|uniref:DUF4157 domain-containing protein n=2 Tax=Thalassomonas haliotis TaxID=485448 RepID=A0ABY7VL95_9GAMM|nr:DUF4157 domain-containing protein [Thalassomonas haliotis]
MPAAKLKKQKKKRQHKLEEEKEQQEVQAKTNNSKTGSPAQTSGADSTVNSTISSTTARRIGERQGSGQAMDTNTKHFMEANFHKDFSNVRIHNDNEANQLSQQLHAQAFTLKQDIYFNAGKYNPDSRSGKHLLAHELTHVVQQNAALADKSPRGAIAADNGHKGKRENNKGEHN